MRAVVGVGRRRRPRPAGALLAGAAALPYVGVLVGNQSDQRRGTSPTPVGVAPPLSPTLGTGDREQEWREGQEP